MPHREFRRGLIVATILAASCGVAVSEAARSWRDAADARIWLDVRIRRGSDQVLEYRAIDARPASEIYAEASLGAPDGYELARLWQRDGTDETVLVYRRSEGAGVVPTPPDDRGDGR